MKIARALVITCAMTLSTACIASETGAPEMGPGESGPETNPYMGAPVTLGTGANGAIVNQKLLDRLEAVTWMQPTIEQPAEGIWTLGGYTLAPISIIDTDDGLIAFDTGDSKHDGEVLLEVIRSFSDKPVRAIIYGHSHTALGAGDLTEGNEDVIVIGHPDLNSVVEQNLRTGGAPNSDSARGWRHERSGSRRDRGRPQSPG